jgi:hypothetical protein
MTTDQFDQFSDTVMLSVLEQIEPEKRQRLLEMMRKLSHPNSHPGSTASWTNSPNSTRRFATPNKRKVHDYAKQWT